ncbi:hypothetical protein ACLOJK_023404 [Asimina triloba]
MPHYHMAAFAYAIPTSPSPLLRRPKPCGPFLAAAAECLRPIVPTVDAGSPPFLAAVPVAVPVAVPIPVPVVPIDLPHPRPRRPCRPSPPPSPSSLSTFPIPVPIPVVPVDLPHPRPRRPYRPSPSRPRSYSILSSTVDSRRPNPSVAPSSSRRPNPAAAPSSTTVGRDRVMAAQRARRQPLLCLRSALQRTRSA